MLEKLAHKPKIVFLTDGIGAMITACLNLFILAPFHYRIGLPQFIFYLLGMVAVAFMLFSFYCFSRVIHQQKPYFITLITANSGYCLITLSLIIIYNQQITPLGFIYFMAELTVILLVIALEKRTLERL